MELLELWKVALSPEAASRLDLRQYVTNSMVGGWQHKTVSAPISVLQLLHSRILPCGGGPPSLARALIALNRCLEASLVKFEPSSNFSWVLNQWSSIQHRLKLCTFCTCITHLGSQVGG